MQFTIPRAIQVLERTPAVLRAQLEGLEEAWIAANEGPRTWSAFDVVGHLIHGEETDWIPRARIILERGEARTFVPFDRFAQLERSAGAQLAQLLRASPPCAGRTSPPCEAGSSASASWISAGATPTSVR